MATINLLPWREEFRQQKKKEFFEYVGIVLLSGFLILFAWDRIVNAGIDNQNERNALLNTEIETLNAQVKEIAELKQRRQQLLDRMTVIQSLQANRPEIVRIFDELARSVPDGVYLGEIKRLDMAISIIGYAESNNRVSALMRNLGQSYKFMDPNLTKVETDERLGDQGNIFEMRVKITAPEVVDQKGKGA